LELTLDLWMGCMHLKGTHLNTLTVLIGLFVSFGGDNIILSGIVSLMAERSTRPCYMKLFLFVAGRFVLLLRIGMPVPGILISIFPKNYNS